MEKLVLNKINVRRTRMGSLVQYNYDVPPILQKYIRNGTPFDNVLFVEFPGDVKEVPEAVLAIPFVGIMLTVTMLLNVGIQVPELDSRFLSSVMDVGKCFGKMYPKAQIKAIVKADKEVDCSYSPLEKKSLFFTGGVDATSALVELADDSPLLVNIWGGDLWITDDASHESLKLYLDQLTGNLNLKYCFIKTNARAMFDEDQLGQLCESLLGHKNNHGWWASIAHILSMTTTIAPWIWMNRIKTHYIGSSYDGITKTFDSNNEEMIHAIRYCSCNFAMVDRSVGRNKKVKKIVRFHQETGTPISLKVCWYRTAGKNCCACEKCYRSIMNLIANHADPNEYGFVVTKKTLYEMRKFLKTNTVSIAFWKPIHQAFLDEQDFWEKIPEMSWVLRCHLNSPAVYASKLKRRLFRR